MIASREPNTRYGGPHGLVWATLVLVGALAASCSMLLEFEECSSDDDCADLNAPGQILVCSPEHTCVAGDECWISADCARYAPRTLCQHGACVLPPQDTRQDDLSDASDGTDGGSDAELDLRPTDTPAHDVPSSDGDALGDAAAPDSHDAVADALGDAAAPDSHDAVTDPAADAVDVAGDLGEVDQ